MNNSRKLVRTKQVTKWRKGDPHLINGGDSGLSMEGAREIAEFFGRSDTTIYDWIHKGLLPAAKLPNGHWFTNKSLLLEWLMANNEAELEARKS